MTAGPQAEPAGLVEQLRFVVELLTLACGIGYWAGQAISKRRAPGAKTTLDLKSASSITDIERRLETIEDSRKGYVPRQEIDHRFGAIASEIESLRKEDNSNRERMDKFMGNGG